MFPRTVRPVETGQPVVDRGLGERATYCDVCASPHGGIHRLLYEILDEIASGDRANRALPSAAFPFPLIGDSRLSTREPIAFVQRAHEPPPVIR